MLAVLIIGLLINAVVLPLAGMRVLFLYRAISHGQPAPDRIEGAFGRVGMTLKRQVVEVFGQKKLLRWSIPGTAHFFVFWAFLILGTVYLEAYAVLLSRNPEWSWFVFGNWSVLGFVQDFIAVMCFLGIGTFWWIRIVNNPKNKGRGSRFFGSHLGPAYFTLFMIFNVLWTLFFFRGAVEARDMALGHGDGYGKAAFVSYLLGKVLPDSTALIGIGLILHIGVMLAFLVFVLNSKHLHIFLAPLNVMFGREPVALGAAKPMMNAGKPMTLEDLEEMDEDTKLGVGAAEDFSWKGVLDMTSCTECGRCQDQCPAWNTEKPLSPKLMIMALRDHTLAKTPYLLADEGKRETMLEGNAALKTEVERPLVGDTGDEWFYMPEDGSGVIDPDVLWSCVTCGACVQQCPVDIEHVDHIVDMRRYQVLVESNFPAELNGLFKGLENKGNPWNMSSTARLDWAKDLPFEVKVVGEDIESLDEVDWLFWVGCAGAYEDRAKKTTRAVAELLDMAGVSFGVLGNGETCTGDSARRAGNEFVFQGLATQNIETFKEYKVKKAVTTCAHCFNTLKNEYKQLGIELEVVHHTQLLNRLVREKKLAPVAATDGASKRSVTYHDPCYIGRHNQVYSPPRELLQVIPDANFVEMPRNSERSFCCGAGGARMWMEETIGTRINETRTKEAVDTGADQIAVACPFCRVMLSDGLTSAQSKGEAREEVEVLDVAQMLLASVKGESKPVAKQAAAASERGGGTATATLTREDEETKAEPEEGDTTQTSETVSRTEDVGAAAKAHTGGGSLFDDPESSDSSDAADEESAGSAAETKSEAAESLQPEAKTGRGSLFDLGSDDESEEPEPAAKKAEPEAEKEPEPEPAAKSESSGLGGGGSLFDLGSDDEDEPEVVEPEASETKGEAKGEDPAGDSTTDQDVDRSEDAADTDVEPEAEAEPEPAVEKPASSGASVTPASEIPEGGSLFDLAEPEETTAPAAKVEPEPEPEPAEKTEDAAADSTTDQDVDHSETQSSGAGADTDVEPEPEQAEADEAAAEERTEEPAATPASSGTTITPASEIPEGGSLFDLAEPEETTAPAAKAAPEPEPEPAEKTEDPAGDSTTGEDVDRSETQSSGAGADTDVEPEPEEAEADEAGGLGGKYPAGQSMFDVPDGAESTSEPAATSEPEDKAVDEDAPAGEDPAGHSTTDADVDRRQDAADTSTEDEPAEETSSVTSLKDIKAKFSGGSTEEPEESTESTEPVADAAAEPAEDDSTDEAAPEEKSKPASSGETYEPKTDKDIGEAGSLFDL